MILLKRVEEIFVRDLCEQIEEAARVSNDKLWQSYLIGGEIRRMPDGNTAINFRQALVICANQA